MLETESQNTAREAAGAGQASYVFVQGQMPTPDSNHGQNIFRVKNVYFLSFINPKTAWVDTSNSFTA